MTVNFGGGFNSFRCFCNALAAILATVAFDTSSFRLKVLQSGPFILKFSLLRDDYVCFAACCFLVSYNSRRQLCRRLSFDDSVTAFFLGRVFLRESSERVVVRVQ